MGQKPSAQGGGGGGGNSNKKGQSQIKKNQQLSNRIKSRLETINKDLKTTIENNYAISNYNSNSYLAYNIKKAEEGTHEIQFNWYEYAEEECELIKKAKSYCWLDDTLRLLEEMKKDPKVREFQRNALMSLIYTIESMTEMDYLVDVPIETYEELFDQGSSNQETILKANFRQQRTGTSLFGNSQNLDSLEDSFLQYRTSSKTGQAKKDAQKNQFSTKEAGLLRNNNQNNLKTLIERIPVFEEELHENVQGTKIDTNFLRSEVYTVLADQEAPVLCYSQCNEEMNLARKMKKPQAMNNHTILLGSPVTTSSPQADTAANTPSCSGGSQRQQQDSHEAESFSDALKMVNFYKRIYIFLERQLDRKVNPLRAIIKLFKKHFAKTYSSLLNQGNAEKQAVKSLINLKSSESKQVVEPSKLRKSDQGVKTNEDNLKQKDKRTKLKDLNGGFSQSKKELKQGEIKTVVEDMIAEMQQFLHFTLYCVIFFYDLDNILPQKQYSQLVNKENLWNFLINILFADDEVYKTCFQLIDMSLAENSTTLTNKFHELQEIQPQHLEIHPRFCLNRKTYIWQVEKQTKKQQARNTKDNQQLLKMKCCDAEEEKKNEDETHSQKLQEIEDIPHLPYEKAIIKLRNLQFYNSPIHKMKLIAQCFELIPICIEEFYQQYLNDFDGQNLIASDDLMNILVYIVVKSGVSDLNSHMKMISSFLSKSAQQTKIGYYCTSLMIVANYLESDRIFECVSRMQEESRIIERSLASMNSSLQLRSTLKTKPGMKSASRSSSPQRLSEHTTEMFEVSPFPSYSKEITEQ